MTNQNESKVNTEDTQKRNASDNLHGTMNFTINAFTDEDKSELKKKINDLIMFFPETFRNPISGQPISGLISVHYSDDGYAVFSLKNPDKKEMELFFKLNLNEKQKYAIDALNNKGTLFLMTLFEAIWAINNGKLLPSETNYGNARSQLGALIYHQIEMQASTYREKQKEKEQLNTVDF